MCGMKLLIHSKLQRCNHHHHHHHHTITTTTTTTNFMLMHATRKLFFRTHWDLPSWVLTLLVVAYCFTPFKHRRANKCACASVTAIESHMKWTCSKQLLTSYIVKNRQEMYLSCLVKLIKHNKHYNWCWRRQTLKWRGPFSIDRYLSRLSGARVYHDDVIKWKHFPHNRPFVRGIHRSPVNSPHKGQWRGALMFSLICVWINGWVNNREAGD